MLCTHSYILKNSTLTHADNDKSQGSRMSYPQIYSDSAILFHLSQLKLHTLWNGIQLVPRNPSQFFVAASVRVHIMSGPQNPGTHAGAALDVVCGGTLCIHPTGKHTASVHTFAVAADLAVATCTIHEAPVASRGSERRTGLLGTLVGVIGLPVSEGQTRMTGGCADCSSIRRRTRGAPPLRMSVAHRKDAPPSVRAHLCFWEGLVVMLARQWDLLLVGAVVGLLTVSVGQELCLERATAVPVEAAPLLRYVLSVHFNQVFIRPHVCHNLCTWRAKLQFVRSHWLL